MIQGLVFSGLLFWRFAKQKVLADLYIAMLLLLMAWHRTTYMIGFMGWYDTFKNTKVNYFLIYFGLAIGPLIYLYVRAHVKSKRHFAKQDYLHFLPVVVYVLYRVTLFVHDSAQPGFDKGYEGEWMRNFSVPYIEPMFEILTKISMILYLAFTVQLFILHKRKILHFFSDTSKMELNWIRNFLILYVFLFVIGFMFDVTDTVIFDLNYKQVWWVHLLNAASLIYLGFMALRSKPLLLQNLSAELNNHSLNMTQLVVQPEQRNDFKKEANQIQLLFTDNHMFLDPDLTLSSVAKQTGMSTHLVSQVINTTFTMNFKEYVNQFRVEEVKRRLKNSEYDHLTISGIALDCGFNSKATFNRVFKAMTGLSPSAYKKKKRVEAS